MQIELPKKPAPLVTTGYSMPQELKDMIAEQAEKLGVSASALVTAVMVKYLDEDLAKTKRRKK